MNLAPLADAAVTGAAGAIAALVALLIPRIPLLVTWLRVNINGADTTLVRHAIANAALNEAREMERGLGADLAVSRMVRYAQDSLPDTIRRVGLSPETLAAMCRAEMARQMAGRG